MSTSRNPVAYDSNTASKEPYVSEPILSRSSKTESFASAVSWAAVTAGAFVAAALSLVLLALGAGAGLSTISPWSSSTASPTAVGIGALIFLALVEIIASGMGGYLAGRLRTKWVNVHSDEVYFRDTAHGFLSWCVAFVLTAAFLTSAAAAMVGQGTRNSRESSATDNAAIDANRYYVDALFRSTRHATAAEDAADRAEAGVIFARALRDGQLSSDDKNYLADLVSARTGVNHAEAESRVANVFERDRVAADQTRKAVAHSLYWLFVALLLGAFSASLAATLGGRRRDHIPAHA
jgi:hypothetical protein